MTLTNDKQIVDLRDQINIYARTIEALLADGDTETADKLARDLADLKEQLCRLEMEEKYKL